MQKEPEVGQKVIIRMQKAEILKLLVNTLMQKGIRHTPMRTEDTLRELIYSHHLREAEFVPLVPLQLILRN